MGELPVQNANFRVDTSRPRSKTKMRSKFRHVLAVASGMFPLMALFVFAMSLLRLEAQRRPYYQLSIAFLACGMVALLFYAWARAEKQRRREISARNRERKYQERAEEFRRERERLRQRQAAAGTQEK